MFGVMLTAILMAARAAPSAATPDRKHKTHVVTIEGMRFNPETLIVQRGDRIMWVNNDPFPHSATATGSDFDSRSISPNASWTYVPKKPGDYPYSCSFHPTMKATLSVR
jgi:plastocyanin